MVLQGRGFRDGAGDAAMGGSGWAEEVGGDPAEQRCRGELGIGSPLHKTDLPAD